MAKKKPETALVPREPEIPAHILKHLEDAAKIAAGARSKSTERAYDTNVTTWKEFAEVSGFEVFPISEAGLLSFVMHMKEQGKKLATIQRHCTALSQWHKTQGQTSPTEEARFREFMKGLSRAMDSRPVKKRALTAELVRGAVAVLDSSQAKEAQACAVLLFGFSTGMRRSEIAALRWSDVEEKPDGLSIYIAESKTDQEGHGAWIAIPRDVELAEEGLCPIVALAQWRKHRDPEEDRVFGCSGRTINRIVKAAVEAQGEDPAEYGAHSFRSGFVTEAKRAGADLDDIMGQTRHKSERVARGYIQRIDAMSNPAASAVLQRLRRKK